MSLKNFRSERLRAVALEAMKNECYRQLSATGGNVKAAAINLGYTNPHSFYQTLQRLGIKIERVTRIKDAHPEAQGQTRRFLK